MKSKFLTVSAIMLLLMIGCDGCLRNCQSSCANNLGADWLVVQYDMNGDPFNCWQLSDVSLSSEPNSDGIQWLDKRTGNMVHLSGWYNHVQTTPSSIADAAITVGIDLAKCSHGHYQN